MLLVHVILAFLINSLLPLDLPEAATWFGYFLALAGVGLAFSAVSRLMQEHTTLDPHGSVTKVVTNGPYQISRNPIYLGFLCLVIGFPLIFGNVWGVFLGLLFVLSMNRLVIRHEEAYLEKKFGAVYTSYKSRVRRWV